MYLGIEIGGTKLQLGIGDGAGVLHALVRDTIAPADGADGIRRQIERALPQAVAQGDGTPLRGVGIGFGGPVDDATRTVIKSHQIAGWDGFPLADWISDLVGLPAVLGNDADVAGLAEALFGAGKGMSPIFYITIGSGIGGGLIINGEIYRGCGRGAAEIGHLRVLVLIAKFVKKYQTLESIASGWAIETRAEQEMKRYPNKWDPPFKYALEPTEQQTPTLQQIASAAAAGHESSKNLLRLTLETLAEEICHVIALLCPRRIVIGGGVSLIGKELLFEPLRKLVADRVFRPFADCYDIVPAALGEAVVVHGALALARKQFG